MASSEEASAKLFVGCLPPETTEGDVVDHFGSYGEVAEAVILRDRPSGVSRGFGFVSFVDRVSAERALNVGNHVILHRTVEVRRALPKGRRLQNDQHLQNHLQHGTNERCSSNSSFGTHGNRSRSKIFVGGLSSGITEVELKSFFAKFGPIIDGVVMFDSTTRRTRGFGFVTFESEDDAEDVLKQSYYELKGRTVEVKRAVPKGSMAGNDSDGSNGFLDQAGVYPYPGYDSSYPGMVYPNFSNYYVAYNAPWAPYMAGNDTSNGLMSYVAPYAYPSYYMGCFVPPPPPPQPQYMAMSKGSVNYYNGS